MSAAGEALARLFHDTYERLAPDFNYSTRVASAVPWEDVPEPNKTLMIATADAILAAGYHRTPDNAAKLAEVADELNGLMDSLDEHVTHDDIYEALRRVWNMARPALTPKEPTDG